MIRAIVVEDVEKIRNSFLALINKELPSISVVDTADTVEKAYKVILQYKPDLVFLDIELLDGTAFDLLSKFSTIEFKIIFVTAYSEYSIRAFKFSAIDYLLKPIDKDELIVAVQRATQQIEKETFNLKLQTLITNFDGKTKPTPRKIVLRTAEKIYSIDVSDIVRCESEKNYTDFYLITGQRIVVSITIKEYDDMLSPYNFFRVHQSHLINMSYFNYFDKADGGFAIMKDGSRVPVASRKKDDLLKLL